MITDIAILIGRKGSKGFPNKNTKIVKNKAMCEYPLIAAKKVKSIKKIFVATDCEKIKKFTKKYDVEFIDRPKRLNSDTALGEDVYKYCYDEAKKILDKENIKIRYIVLLMANAPMINAKLINDGIKKLNKNKKADSAVTVSKYNMWSPIRARKVNTNGYLDPFIPFKNMKLKTINCDRDSQGDVYYADMLIGKRLFVIPKLLHVYGKIGPSVFAQNWHETPYVPHSDKRFINTNLGLIARVGSQMSILRGIKFFVESEFRGYGPVLRTDWNSDVQLINKFPFTEKEVDEHYRSYKGNNGVESLRNLVKESLRFGLKFNF